jgi:hypothetical protein
MCDPLQCGVNTWFAFFLLVLGCGPCGARGGFRRAVLDDVVVLLTHQYVAGK